MSASIFVTVTGTVVKVTKSGLPQNDRGGLLYSVAILPDDEEDTVKVWVTDTRLVEALGKLAPFISE